MAVTPTLTGADLRAWREAHGWTAARCTQALQYWGDPYTAMRRWEYGVYRIPERIQRYVRAHPAPPAVDRYPSTPEGLRTAIDDYGGSNADWCTWWGVTQPTFYRWLQGVHKLPLSVCAWLRAGAPPEWQQTPPSIAADTPPPPAVPYQPRPVPRRRWPERGSSEAFLAAREAAGLGRREVAAQLGVTVECVHDWETRRSPPLAAIHQIQPQATAAGWVYATGVGWVPPADDSEPERDALTLPGCGRCGYRGQCVELYGAQAG